LNNQVGDIVAVYTINRFEQQKPFMTFYNCFVSSTVESVEITENCDFASLCNRFPNIQELLNRSGENAGPGNSSNDVPTIRMKTGVFPVLHFS